MPLNQVTFSVLVCPSLKPIAAYCTSLASSHDKHLRLYLEVGTILSYVHGVAPFYQANDGPLLRVNGGNVRWLGLCMHVVIKLKKL